MYIFKHIYKSHPYYEEGVGCVNSNYCDSLGPFYLARDIFTFKAPKQNTICPYEYKLCTSNSDCDTGLFCNIPKSNYATCIPLAAKFDRFCNLVTGCSNCIDDCMGTGYGYCMAERILPQPIVPTLFPRPPRPILGTPIPEISLCEVGGCSGQICAVGGSKMVSTCEWRCEYGCNRYRICGNDAQGNCGWQTNIDQEANYQNCVNRCSNSGGVTILTI